MRQGREQGLIEALIAKAAIEAFHNSVLHRLAGCDVVPFDMSILTPFQDGRAGHFRAVVRNNRSGLAPSCDDCIQFPAEPSTRQRCIRNQCQALSREIINDRQHAEPAAIGESIADEIQAPPLIGA